MLTRLKNCKTVSMRMREAGFPPRAQSCLAENGDVIPSWGYTEAREQLFDARQALVAALVAKSKEAPCSPAC